jgi:hypothetical protein
VIPREPIAIVATIVAGTTVPHVAGCASRGAAPANPGVSLRGLTTARPRPPAIAFDPPTRLPLAAPVASAEARLAVLKEPTSVRMALRVVADFFGAVGGGSSDALQAVLDDPARVHAGPRARPEAALPYWRRRMERLDYGVMSTIVLYRTTEVETYAASDAEVLSASRPLPAMPREGELMVRVPLARQGVGPRLFGSEIFFLLVASPDGYRIRDMYEDFRIP